MKNSDIASVRGKRGKDVRESATARAGRHALTDKQQQQHQQQQHEERRKECEGKFWGGVRV